MARIATITKKEDLAPEHQKVYDAIAQSRGVVGGPWPALLHSPELAARTAHLGGYVRFESTLDHKVVELTALVSACELDSKHEWAAHIIHGQKAGISMETIRACPREEGRRKFFFRRRADRQFCARDYSDAPVSEPTFQRSTVALARKAWSS